MAMVIRASQMAWAFLIRYLLSAFQRETTTELVKTHTQTQINFESYFKFPISISSVYHVAYFQPDSLPILFAVTVSPSSLNAKPS
jgi:hypothetical protein